MESVSALNRTVLCLQSARLQERGEAGEQNSKETTNRGPGVRVGTEEERRLLRGASAQAALTACRLPLAHGASLLPSHCGVPASFLN